VVIAVFQAYGIAVGLEGQANVVTDPGWFFRVSTVLTLTGGTLFLMWLGEQITSRGVGNGSSLIIFAGIVAAFPAAIANTLELSRQGAISPLVLLGLLVMSLAVVAFIVFMERAQRRLLITYPKRQQGNRIYEGQTSFLPLKLNTSGVIPPIFASSLLLLPTTMANLRFLLYRDRVRSGRDGGQSEEAWRLHPGRASGRSHRPLHRPHPDSNHGSRRRLSGADLPPTRNAHFPICASVLFRRYVTADRGQRHDGYGCANSRLSPGAAV
jgi:hypothetical protein